MIFKTENLINTFFFAMCFFMVTGCLSYTTPKGNWRHAPVLFNTSDSHLKDKKIEIICGKGPRNKFHWEIDQSKACEHTATVLASYGANIVGDYKPEDPDEEESESSSKTISTVAEEINPDFKLVIIERGTKPISSAAAICYWFTFYPCITVRDSKLEIRYTDPSNTIIKQSFIHAEVTRMYGIGVLPIFLTRLANDSNEYRRRGRPMELMTHIVNLTHSVNYQFSEKQKHTKVF